MNRRRNFGVAIGAIALLLGGVIVFRGLTEHAGLLYDLVGVLFLALGGVRLYEARRGRR